MNTSKSPSILPAIIVFLVVWVISLLFIGEVVCSDGRGSSSIGRSGACSHHGGVRSWPSNLAFFGSGLIAFIFHEFRSRRASAEKNKINHLPLSTSLQTSVSDSLPITPKVRRRRSTKCPRCSAGMLLKTAKKGLSTGSQFWGCAQYPKCKGTRKFEGDT